MGRAEAWARRTVLQGGFTTGQRVTLSGPPAPGASGTLGAWLEEQGRWEVAIDGGGEGATETAAVRADNLRLESFSGDVAEDLLCDEKIDDNAWRGRQAVANPTVGDLVQVHHSGCWVDAVIVEVIGAAGGTGGADAADAAIDAAAAVDGVVAAGAVAATVRVVLVDGCKEVSSPLSRLRRKENYLAHQRRLEACALARAKMQNNKKISDEDVLEVLRVWAFTPNPVRRNVIPKGERWVYSDTLGLVRSRCSSACVETRLAAVYPDMMRMLSRWARARCSKLFGCSFPFTSINLNFAYGARLHRDRHNVGPSLLRALGDFQGGALGYLPDDDRKLPLEALPFEKRIKIDTRSEFRLIDGQRAHCVEDFTGERFSVVFFCCSSYPRASATLRRSLVKAGAVWPTKASLAAFCRRLRPPRGYSVPAPLQVEGKRKASNQDYAAGRCRRLRQKTAVAAEAAGGRDNDDEEEEEGEEMGEELAKRKERQIGGRFRLLQHPHLALGLQLQRVYTMSALVRKCKGDLQKLTALRRKLQDPATFEPMPESR